MDRRSFLAAASGSAIFGGSLATSLPGYAATKPQIIELRRFQLRNTQDNMVQRTNEYLGQVYVPALKKLASGPVGAFGSFIGEGSPFTLLVSQFADIRAWEESSQKITADRDVAKASDTYFGGPLQYNRMDLSLLRGFSTMPGIETPSQGTGGDQKAHLFELRTYESNNSKTLARKIRMFDEGEIGLFRKLGMIPVFFGEALTGKSLPNLTYMLAYDDISARDKAWTTFVNHPEWEKMKGQPGVSDAEIVSNISNSLLRPLPFSVIR
jgi:hypothetical protein